MTSPSQRTRQEKKLIGDEAVVEEVVVDLEGEVVLVAVAEGVEGVEDSNYEIGREL